MLTLLNYIYYLFPYLLVFAVLYFYPQIGRPSRKAYCILTFLILWLFAGLSYDVGWDYLEYINSMKVEGHALERYETLEYWLALCSKHLGSYQLFFIGNHLIIMSLVMMVIYRSSSDYVLSTLFFVGLPLLYLMSFATIRCAAALSVVFFSYDYFLKRDKYLFFILFVFIASLFHQTAFIALLLLPLHIWGRSRWINICLLIIAVFFARSGTMVTIPGMEEVEAMSDIYSRYEYSEKGGGDSGGGDKLHYLYLFFNIVNLFFFSKLSRIGGKQLERYISFVNMGCCIAFIFSFNPLFAMRFSRYYYIFIILIAPYYCQLFKRFNEKNVRLALVSFVFLIFLYQLILPNYNGADISRVSTYWPYRLYFFNL